MRLAPRGAAVAQTTILGFGSLLSEQSSRLTFPDLENFRLVRVPDYRRLMQHPASIFFQRGIADPQKKNWCSLSAEPCPGASFVACAFEVVFEGEQRAAYELREEEFDVVSAPYTTLDGAPAGEGLLCAQWTDEGYARSTATPSTRRDMGSTASSKSGAGRATAARRRARSTCATASSRPRRPGPSRPTRSSTRRGWWIARRRCPTVPSGAPRGHGHKAAARARGEACG